MIKSYSKKLTEELEYVDRIRDGLDLPVDRKIRLLVASLRSLGFITTSSCSGHISRGTPYVDISSIESLQFEKDTKVQKAIELLLDNPDNLKHQIAYEKLCTKPIRYNLLEANRLLDLLANFYKDKKTSTYVQLVVESIGGGLGGYRVYPQGSLIITLKTRYEKLIWLKSAQSEMDAFAEFLIDKLK